MFENLSNDHIIIIMCITGAIILVSLIMLILVIKTDGKKKPKVKKEKPAKETPKNEYKEARTEEEHAQDEKNETSIEEVLTAINVDIETKKDAIDVYEDDQEEHAIISYTELINRKNTLEEQKEELIIEPVQEEIIQIEEELIIEAPQSEFNLNFEENDEFLNSLKDFRNNL